MVLFLGIENSSFKPACLQRPADPVASQLSILPPIPLANHAVITHYLRSEYLAFSCLASVKALNELSVVSPENGEDYEK